MLVTEHTGLHTAREAGMSAQSTLVYTQQISLEPRAIRSKQTVFQVLERKTPYPAKLHFRSMRNHSSDEEEKGKLVGSSLTSRDKRPQMSRGYQEKGRQWENTRTEGWLRR